jgi:hypothetical protein
MESTQLCPLLKLEKLLVATDRSVFSEGAVREAINFAKKCSSRVYVVSVLETNPEYETVGANVEKVMETAQKEGISVEALTPIGKPHEVIVEIAGGRGVDLIVMGTYGKTGLKKFLMGSATEKVIGHAGCAVLTVGM